jgi:hypothetical protein
MAARQSAPAATMPSNAELFVEHLRSVFGDEDAIHKADAPEGGPPVSVFVYKNVPEEGMITGVTYGLSLCPLAAWKFSRPEMIVAVESLELAWPCAAATFAALFRGKKTLEPVRRRFHDGLYPCTRHGNGRLSCFCPEHSFR